MWLGFTNISVTFRYLLIVVRYLVSDFLDILSGTFYYMIYKISFIMRSDLIIVIFLFLGLWNGVSGK